MSFVKFHVRFAPSRSASSNSITVVSHEYSAFGSTIKLTSSPSLTLMLVKLFALVPSLKFCAPPLGIAPEQSNFLPAAFRNSSSHAMPSPQFGSASATRPLMEKFPATGLRHPAPTPPLGEGCTPTLNSGSRMVKKRSWFGGGWGNPPPGPAGGGWCEHHRAPRARAVSHHRSQRNPPTAATTPATVESPPSNNAPQTPLRSTSPLRPRDCDTSPPPPNNPQIAPVFFSTTPRVARRSRH